VRILHFSDWGLPDPRVERCIHTDLEAGHEVVFAGRKATSDLVKSYAIPWSSSAKLHLRPWKKLRNLLANILKREHIDLIHAHDVFAAKMVSELETPFVFNSHEYWVKAQPVHLLHNSRISRLKRLIARNFGVSMWGEWQREIVERVPTLVTSVPILDSYSRYGKKVFLLPNFLSKLEVESIKFSRRYDELTSGYVGRDLSGWSEQRIINHIPKMFAEKDIGFLVIIGDDSFNAKSAKINSLGMLPHDKLLGQLSKCHVGLIPWKRHWYHKYCLPNKVSEYAHTGLLTVASSSLTEVNGTLGKYCRAFNDPTEFVEVMEALRDKTDILSMPRRSGVYLENVDELLFNVAPQRNLSNVWVS